MNALEQVLEHPVMATTLASICIGRVIRNVGQGFAAEDSASRPDIIAQAGIYKTIRAKYPDDTITVPKMFTRIVSDMKANDDGKQIADELNLTEEQRAMWDEQLGASDVERLEGSVQELLALLNNDAKGDVSAWDDLSGIGQYSVIVETENKLPSKAKLFGTWTSENGRKLHKQALVACAAAGKIVEAVYKANEKEIADHEGNLPRRLAA